MPKDRYGISGTPWHVEILTMDEDDSRRHRARCIFYNRGTKKCAKHVEGCYGASHCDFYKEREPEPEENKNDQKSQIQKKESSILSTNELRKLFIENLNQQNKKAEQERIRSKKDFFVPGRKVIHNKYGKGIISEVEGTHVSILFKDTVKKLDLNFCLAKNMLILDMDDIDE